MTVIQRSHCYALYLWLTLNNHILLQVGKVSHYDGDIVVLMPVPEYPIVLDNMDEDTPDDSLYKDDGSLEVVRNFRMQV